MVIYPGAVRGDDVGCNTMTQIGSVTTNFTRDAHSDEQTIASGGAAIARRFPTAEPAPPPTLVRPLAVMYPGVPTPRSARYLTANALEEVISAHVDGWLVEDRFTAPRSLSTSNTIDMRWYATVAEGLKHRQAGGATSVPPPPPPKTSAAGAPPTREEIATARKEGDRILFSNHTQALFENITNSNVIALRHRASGLVCHFDLGAAGAITLGPGTWIANRADAVNCVAGVASQSNTLTIMPNSAHLTPEQAMAEAIAVLKSARSDLAPATTTGVTMNTNPSLPRHVTARIAATSPSDPQYFHLAVAVVGGWIVLDEVSGPPAQSEVADLIGEIEMITAIGDIVKTKPETLPKALLPAAKGVAS